MVKGATISGNGENQEFEFLFIVEIVDCGITRSFSITSDIRGIVKLMKEEPV